MMTFMGIGTILVKEINGLIQSVNDNLFHYHKEEEKTSQKRTPEQVTEASQASGQASQASGQASQASQSSQATNQPTHNVSDYPLGRKSPRPFWREVVPNTHD